MLSQTVIFSFSSFFLFINYWILVHINFLRPVRQYLTTHQHVFWAFPFLSSSNKLSSCWKNSNIHEFSNLFWKKTFQSVEKKTKQKPTIVSITYTWSWNKSWARTTYQVRFTNSGNHCCLSRCSPFISLRQTCRHF